MNIHTKYFGQLNINEKKIIKFPQGIPGFNEVKDFVLLPLPENEVFQILQSTRHADPAFVVVNPYHFLKEYEFEIDESTIDLLEIKEASDVQVYSIVSLKDPFKQSTVNLQAPIIINSVKLLGKQYVTNDKQYTTKEQMFSKNTSKVKGD